MNFFDCGIAEECEYMQPVRFSVGLPPVFGYMPFRFGQIVRLSSDASHIQSLLDLIFIIESPIRTSMLSVVVADALLNRGMRHCSVVGVTPVQSQFERPDVARQRLWREMSEPWQ